MEWEKAAQNIPSLKSYNPKYKWSLQDQLLHERTKKIHNQEASVMFRNNVLESQKRTNYINEYERLRGELESGVAGRNHPLEEKLKKRQQKIRDMAKLSADRRYKGRTSNDISELDQPEYIYR